MPSQKHWEDSYGNQEGKQEVCKEVIEQIEWQQEEHGQQKECEQKEHGTQEHSEKEYVSEEPEQKGNQKDSLEEVIEVD